MAFDRANPPIAMLTIIRLESDHDAMFNPIHDEREKPPKIFLIRLTS